MFGVPEVGLASSASSAVVEVDVEVPKEPRYFEELEVQLVEAWYVEVRRHQPEGESCLLDGE